MMDFENLGESILKRAKSELKGPSYNLLEAELMTKDAFKGFRRRKEDLEALLTCAVCVLEFKPKDEKTPRRILCCSNIRFVNAYKAVKKADMEKALRSQYAGMHARDASTIMTYDLMEGKLKTIGIPPNTWYVPHAWMFSEKTIPALIPLIKECLKI